MALSFRGSRAAPSRRQDHTFPWERVQETPGSATHFPPAMTMTTSSTAKEGEASEVSAFLFIKNTPVYFQEDWGTGIGGGLWSTGLAFARYLQHHSDHALHSLDKLAGNGKKLSLLELGSGNGLLAICFLALTKHYWKELVITDVESHLELIQTTLDANPHLTADSNVTVMEHKWGEFEECQGTCEKSIQDGVKDGTYKFDLIIGSDVAYREALYDPLIESLQRFCHAKTVALIGVTMNDTKPLCFHKLRKAGFKYERLADWLMEPEFRGTSFGIFVIQRNETRDKL